MGVKVRIEGQEPVGQAYKRLKRLVAYHQRFETYEQHAKWAGVFIRPCDARRSAENRRKSRARMFQRASLRPR